MVLQAKTARNGGRGRRGMQGLIYSLAITGWDLMGTLKSSGLVYIAWLARILSWKVTPVGVGDRLRAVWTGRLTLL